MRLLVIKGDYNDADYVTSEHDVDNQIMEMLSRVIPAIKKQSEKDSHTWDISDNSECRPEDMYPELSEDDIELMNELIPYGPNGGIHTIKSICVFEGSVETLYKGN